MHAPEGAGRDADGRRGRRHPPGGRQGAITAYARRKRVHLADSFAYSNGTEDAPVLKAVGHPRPLNPDPGLADVAHMRGWPITRLEPPRRGFALVPALRTGAALTALGAFTALGASVGLLNRNRQAGANIGVGACGDVALALGGVTLNVTGEQNLWSARPAVFMFNHQSGLDMLVLADLLRRDVTGVAKKELAHDPRFAPFGRLAGIVYIDRFHTQNAKEALRPAVSKLRHGITMVIAPEGTPFPGRGRAPSRRAASTSPSKRACPSCPSSSATPGELMWRNSPWMYPGTVDVAVLEPIPASGWDEDDLNDHIAFVRQRFLDTLDSWPGGTDGTP